MASSSAPAPGTILMGELALEEQLGSAVYRARRTRDGRELSMRIVKPRTPQEASEFLALAATASRVRHPALASVEAYGKLDNERCYIASELVSGQRLDEWADAIGIPPLAQVVELVRRLCVGLQAAARAGVVHDAIHARNVRIQSAGAGSSTRMPVKLLGLGVPALLFNNTLDAEALRFMAPEQLQVLSRSELPATFRCSAQMNVYSCGALLYYLATGGAPFTGSTAPELLAAQAGAPLVPPARINPQITAGLNAVVMRALELDPSDRFTSAAELGEALAAVFGSVSPPRKREESSEHPIGEDAFGEEPPTFRTSVSSISELERVAAIESLPAATSGVLDEVTPERHDTPTLPPAAPAANSHSQVLALAEARDSISGVAPIGLFSSSPPHLRSSLPSSEVTNAGAPKPTPLAAFSEPPRVVSLETPPGSTPPPPQDIEYPPTPSVARASVPPNDVVMRPRGRQAPWPMLAVPLAVGVCLLAFFTVRSLLGPAEYADAVGALPTPPVDNALPAQPPPKIVPPASPPAHVPNVQGATTQLRPYISAAEVEDDDREASDGPRGPQRGRRAAREAREAARRNNAPVLPAAAASPAPRERVSAPQVDERIEEPTPAPVAAKAEESEATPSVVIPAPEPAAAAPREPIARVQPAPIVRLPLTAKVQIDAVEVRGSLPKSQVRHAVERLGSQLKQCYERSAQAAGQNRFGELIVAVEIDERGRARSPRVRGGGLPQLDGCVSEIVSHLITGRVPDTGTVTATWKIVFTP
jgi:serine/threonine protein kinase